MMCVISRDHERMSGLLRRLRGAGDLAERGGLASRKWKFSYGGQDVAALTNRRKRWHYPGFLNASFPSGQNKDGS